MRYNLYWGDSHTNIHSSHMDTIEKTFNYARDILDFFPIAYYPFYYYKKNGLRIETCSHEKKFDKDWEAVLEMTKKYNEPGVFITFPGYEWHGNRRYYGDHNVFYLDDDKPLKNMNSIEDLYNYLKDNSGIAIPHHTGYKVRERGKDWSYFDPDISPLVEIYSSHGSSEGVDTPFSLDNNKSMGPRSVSGCVKQGLKKGYKMGFIASGDSHYRIPGVWGNGLMGVYAKKLTRKSLWEAFKSRRTYAVTGDRIKVEFESDNSFMGEEIKSSSPKFKVNAIGSGIIDRIDLVKNNEILDCFINTKKSKGKKYKLRISFGWGPENYFNKLKNNWVGEIKITDGEILNVEKAFTFWEQKVKRVNDSTYLWDLHSKARQCKQQLIFTFETDTNCLIEIDCNGKSIKIPLIEGLQKSKIVSYKNEIEKEIKKQFFLNPKEVKNPDVFYHNAYKMKIHQIVPYNICESKVVFHDSNISGENYYYVRIYQKNGQMAWSSPIWVKS